MNKQLLISASVFAIGATHATSAGAQATPPASDQSLVDEQGRGLDQPAAVAADSANAPPAARQESAAASPVNEIVVTAQKRAQSLLEVPTQVAVTTAADLTERGINQASQLLTATPNVTFIEDNAGEAYINIRGQTAVRASDPNVAIVIDGVTLSSTKSFNRNIFGVQQIEVLKGPQTALYGRNAAAGALVITTKIPGDKFEGEVTAAYGKFTTVRASGAVSGPITDTLGFTVAGSTYNTNGPFKSEVSDFYVHEAHNHSLRGRLFYNNGSNLKLDLKVDGHKVTGAGIGYNAQVTFFPIGKFDGGTQLNFDLTDQPFVSNIKGTNDNKYLGVTFKADYDMEFAELTSVTGFSKYYEYFGGDGIPYILSTGQRITPADPLSGLKFAFNQVSQYSLEDKNFSQEVRLTSPGDRRFRWQIGAAYLNFDRLGWTKQSQDETGSLPPKPRRPTPNFASPTNSFQEPVYGTKDYAVFGNVQFDITEQFQIALAGRYDIEKRSIKEVAPDPFNACVNDGNALEDCNAKKTFKEFSPKVTLSYKPTRRALVYASYGKGFKSGGFNPIGSRQKILNVGLDPATVYVEDIYNAEISKSYEIGTKLELLNRRLNFTAAAFKTNVSGAQQFAFIPQAGVQSVVSIDAVKLKGFDAGLDWRSRGGTNLTFGVGYVDGKISKFARNPGVVGNVAPGSAEYTVNVQASQDIPINQSLELVPRLEYNRTGRIWWDIDNQAGTRRDPLDIFNGRLTLRSKNGWQISGYVDNIANKKYYQEIVPLAQASPTFPLSLAVGFRGPTRAYGVETKIDF